MRKSDDDSVPRGDVIFETSEQHPEHSSSDNNTMDTSQAIVSAATTKAHLNQPNTVLLMEHALIQVQNANTKWTITVIDSPPNQNSSKQFFRDISQLSQD